jgi:hypothetical protein
LEGGQQLILLDSERRADCQPVLVSPDQGDRERRATGLLGPARSYFWMPGVDDVDTTPPSRLSLAQGGQQARRAVLQKHDRGPLPGRQAGGALTRVVQQCRRQELGMRVAGLAERVVYCQGMTLVLRSLTAEKPSRFRRQNVDCLFHFFLWNPNG